MSASIRPTRAPRALSARARLAATVDLPTPPLPLATATTWRTPGNSILGMPPAGGCMGAPWRDRKDALSGGSQSRALPSRAALRAAAQRSALVAFAQGPQVFQRIQPRVV